MVDTNLKKHNYMIDLIRFAAALSIMIFHFENFSQSGNGLFIGGYIFVELFFMITGFYTSLHMENLSCDIIGKEALYSIKKTLEKFKRIIPYTIIIIIFQYIFSIYSNSLSIQESFKLLLNMPFELLFLETFGGFFELQVNTLWYLSALLISMTICSYLMLKFRDLYNHILIVFLPIILYSFFWFHHSIFPSNMYYGILPLSIMRGMAGIMLGSLLYKLCKCCEKINLRKWFKLICSIIWLVVCLGIFYISYKSNKYDINLIFMIFVLLLLTLSRCTYIALPANSLIKFLGQLSLPLYICHWSVMKVVDFMFVYYSSTIRFSIMLFCTIIVSVCLYFLIERVKIFSKIYKLVLKDS